MDDCCCVDHSVEISVLFAGSHLLFGARDDQDFEGVVIAFQQPGVDAWPRLGRARRFSRCYGVRGGPRIVLEAGGCSPPSEGEAAARPPRAIPIGCLLGWDARTPTEAGFNAAQLGSMTAAFAAEWPRRRTRHDLLRLAKKNYYWQPGAAPSTVDDIDALVLLPSAAATCCPAAAMPVCIPCA